MFVVAFVFFLTLFLLLYRLITKNFDRWTETLNKVQESDQINLTRVYIKSQIKPLGGISVCLRDVTGF